MSAAGDGFVYEQPLTSPYDTFAGGRQAPFDWTSLAFVAAVLAIVLAYCLRRHIAILADAALIGSLAAGLRAIRKTRETCKTIAERIVRKADRE